MLPATQLRPLLCRSPLYPDESLSSYLHRLAIGNSYVPLSLLTNLIHRRLARAGIKDNLRSPMRPQTYDVLSELTCASAQELAAASIHRLAQAPLLALMEQDQVYLSNGQPILLLNHSVKYRALRRDERAQFCPHCLREAAYHQLSWFPWESTVCLKHQCLLVDTCPCSQGGVSIREIVQCRCSRCGVDLANIATDDISDDALALFAQRTIQLWWGMNVPPKPWDGWGLPAEPVPILHQLFTRLTRSVTIVWEWEHVYGLTTIQPNIHATQKTAFGALVNWPQGFWTFLQTHLQREKALYRCNGLVHPDNSSIVRQLLDLSESPCFHFVGDAVSQFLVANGFKIHSPYTRSRVYWTSR